jgi:hypothetical protein
MPGLIRGVARTAAIAGTATAVSNRVSRRQANRWAAQEQQAYAQPAYQQQFAEPAYAPPPPTPAASESDMDDRIKQLEQLGELRQQGILTDAEFEEQKRRLLA